MGVVHLVINASESGNIDTIRTKVRQFASTVSFGGGIKCIILDEADGLTSLAQKALRGSIEEFAGNCRFIFTGNFGNAIIEPILSRAPLVDFSIEKSERPALLIQFAKAIEKVLKEKGILYTDQELFAVIKKNFPDYRQTWNLLQRYCSTGELLISSQVGINDAALASLFTILKEKKFNDMRAWVVENLDNDGAQLRRALYEKAAPLLVSDSVPQLILHLAEYDYKEGHVMDKEINMVAMLTMIMVDCAWK
jgi:DNA polymerase III delta prime subunit